MSNTRQVMEQALRALEKAQVRADLYAVDNAIDALRAALAEPEQEPVVWMYQDKSTHEVKFQKHMRGFVDHGATYETPLYTAPTPRRPLTDEDVERMIYEATKINPNVADARELLGYIVNAVRVIEAAHGIKEQEP